MPKFGPIPANIDPFPEPFVRNQPKLADNWPTIGRMRPLFCPIWPYPGHSDQVLSNTAQLQPKAPDSGQSRQNLVELGHCMVEVGPTLPNIGRNWIESGMLLPNLAELRANSGQFRRTIGEFSPKSTEVASISTSDPSLSRCLLFRETRAHLRKNCIRII